ncbi:MAG TPA: hypothetical protein EYN51_00970, partial [Flavobacteriales bacterium]|nr:hypothetical protein [Flavobacteriales bacterium]
MMNSGYLAGLFRGSTASSDFPTFDPGGGALFSAATNTTDNGFMSRFAFTLGVTIIPPVDACAGDSTSVLASGGIYYEFLWSTGSTGFTTYLGSGTHYVTVTDTVTCYMRIDSIVIPPCSFTTSPNDTICPGDSALLTVSGGGPYSWTDSLDISTVLGADSFFMAVPAFTTTYAVFDASDTMYITVTVISCNGGCPGNMLPNSSFESNTGFPTLSGDHALVDFWSNASGGGSPDYFHTSGSGIVQLPNAFVGTTFANTGDACMGLLLYHTAAVDFREYIDVTLSSPLTIGQTYEVAFYVTNGVNNGLSSGFGANNIGVHFSTGPVVQIGTAPIAVTPQVNINSIFYSYSWQYMSFLYTATAANDHITIGNFFDDASTNYQLFDSVTGSAYAYILIDDVCLTALSLMAGNDTSICVGDSTTLWATNGSSYSWADSLAMGTILDTDSLFTVAPAMTTTYAVFDATDTQYVTVTVISGVTASITGATAICIGDSTTLTASGGAGYLWNTGPITASITVSPVVNTTYSVTVSSGGCTDTSSVTVTVIPPPTASISGMTSICSGDSTTLTASGGGTYFWNTGAGTSAITVSPASTTSYSVIVSSAGCSDTAGVTVTVSQLPIAN